ncbi:DUF4126 family protein [Pontibacter qinzhouensis]|uniref:DUF4126 family protein n=1 Tax=Pontibacter qinzhouensis TaxID=2603253 RepID=A0A5C8KBQ6_9BACT|nr:DUF4126 family protein [Pontibacter qinzhouensis]TXK50259.1 DUF4126 family protein [Pontibacter qinzhouensis]
MILTEKNTILQAIGMGAIAGMRAMSAPALISHQLHNKPSHLLADSPLRYLQNDWVATGLKVFAASELAGDKMPQASDRIILPSLLTRAASGALVGATVFATQKNKPLVGALVGAAAAIGATYASFYGRKALSAYLPDTACGVIEDIITIGAGWAIARQ